MVVTRCTLLPWFCARAVTAWGSSLRLVGEGFHSFYFLCGFKLVVSFSQWTHDISGCIGGGGGGCTSMETLPLLLLLLMGCGGVLVCVCLLAVLA